MDYEHRLIIKNKRDILTKTISYEKLLPHLIEYKVFNKYMLQDISSIADMFDFLPFRGPNAFRNIIKILRKENYLKEADMLENNTSSEEILDLNLYYRMASKPLGLCLIINNVEFEKNQLENGSDSQDESRFRRLGSDIDANELQRFFESIGFDVTVKENKKASEMIACLKEFSKLDFTDIDSMIVIILSHGNEINNKDCIYGTDWIPVYKLEVCEIFNNKECLQLQNKPKIFFFICCRGTVMDYGARKCLPNESIDSSDIIMPSLSDIFIIHSTLPQQVSIRDYDKGSYFCEELIAVMKEFYKKYDLETMIKIVNRNLQHKVSPVYRIVQVAHVEAKGGTKIINLCNTYTS